LMPILMPAPVLRRASMCHAPQLSLTSWEHASVTVSPGWRTIRVKRRARRLRA